MPAPVPHHQLSSLRSPGMGKVVDARDAVRVIHDGDTVATGGFVGIGFAENIAVALEEYFLEKQSEYPDALGSPRGLTLVYAAGQGDGKDQGLNHFAHPGLLKRVIGGHWGLVPKLQQLAMANQVEAYNLPQGVITHLFRDIAAGKPGNLTRVGLDTFVDPRFGGGKMNSVTQEDLVQLVTVNGEEFLFYRAFPIDIAILRGTTADPEGNITMEREALTLEVLAIAMAAHNSGGMVIVQVERVAERGTLNPRQVKIPGIFVDCVVVAEKPQYHMQTFVEQYSPAFSSEIRVAMPSISPTPTSERKIIARRAVLELQPNATVNLGIGMPEDLSSIAAEEKIFDLITVTTEPGIIGGISATGLNFGAAVNAQAIIDQPYQFDFYDGGGLDIAYLGLGEADAQGNLNVSKFANSLPGAGGFINISQNARKVVFLGTFCAEGLEVRVADGKLKIHQEGAVHKFVGAVEHRTFSGAHAARGGREVLYVTERCVFRLCPKGLELIEIAPGLDLKRDILQAMDFVPVMERPPALMDARIFREEPMGLREKLLAVPMEQRLVFDAKQNLFFINFEGYSVRSREQIEEIRRAIEEKLEPLGRRVAGIVNYDNFSISPELIDEYSAVVSSLVERFYTGVTRYATSPFLRMKLGQALARRGMAPHIYESAAEARSHLTLTDSKRVR